MLGISAYLIGAAATVYGVAASRGCAPAGSPDREAQAVVRRLRSLFASYVGGYAIWLLYGVSVGSMPLILVDLVGLLCGGFTLAITLALRGSLLRPSSWNSCPELID
jgi:hypothetical protein